MAIWTPEYDNTVIWFDSADSNSVISSGGQVSEWRDKSGNLNHATQDVSISQPSASTHTENGYNVITFDGVDDFLVFPTPSNFLAADPKSFFIVYHGNLVGVGEVAFLLGTCVSHGGVDNSGGGYYISLVNDLEYTHKGAGTQLKTFGLSANYAYTIGVVVGADGTTPAIYSDGELVTPTTSTLTTPIVELENGYTAIGLQNGIYAGGRAAEIIGISGVADEATIQKYFGYLAHKWGLDADLPTGHPYESTPPQAPYSISGTILGADGNPASRVVRIHDRSSGELLKETASDAVSGAYDIGLLNNNEVQRVVLADEVDLHNDLVDRVIPG